jgi:hypothetical protein
MLMVSFWPFVAIEIYSDLRRDKKIATVQSSTCALIF